jgi:hypothetical protein
MPTKAVNIAQGFLDPLEPLLLDQLLGTLKTSDLDSFCDQLLAEIENERRELQHQVSQSRFSSLNISEFEKNLDYLLSKSIIRESTANLGLPDVIRYSIGHIFFCKNSIRRIVEYMKSDFRQILENKQSVEAKVEGPGWTRIGRYSRMLRYFVRFLQERTILRELLRDYDYWFETVSYLSAGHTNLPPGRPPPSKQYMRLDELVAASRDLLLEGTSGRFASPPLIRAVVELALTRSLLELPKHSSKYKSKTIETTQTFRIADVMAACRKQSVNVILGPTNLLIETVYKWANETVHNGITFPMEEIVYSHSIVDDLAYGRLGPMFRATSSQIDSLLCLLEQDGEINLK